MLEKFKSKLLRRSTALVVVVALFTVGVFGEHYINEKNTVIENKNAVNVARGEGDLLNYDFSALEMNNQKLKSPDEVQLATTDTEMGKISEELLDAYENLKSVCNADLDNYKEAGVTFNEKVEELNERTEKVFADVNSEETNEYKDYILGNFTTLGQYSSLLCSDDCANVSDLVSQIGELVVPEMEVAELSDDLSFNDVTNDEIEVIEKEEEKNEKTVEIQVDENVSDADTAVTNDIIINDKVKEEFSAYHSVLDIYQYVKNNYQMQFYYGARKGAIGTFEQKSGNDYDISSLLIGVLRDRNVPAKYVRGEVEITGEQAMEWTGASDIESAAKVMSSLGIPLSFVRGSQGGSNIRFEHVWVVAYVPYTDYRGTGNQSGEKLWIPLDASFKRVEYVKDIDITAVGPYIQNDENNINENTEINGVNIGELAEYVTEDNSAFVKYMLENGYGEDTFTEAFGGTQIIEEDLGYLPLTTPYEIYSVIDEFTDIPEKLTAGITISVGSSSKIATSLDSSADFSEKYLATDLYGKRITIAYEPATEEDKEIIDKYNGLFNTPAYLIKLKPVLYVDGEIVAEGNAVTAGSTQRYNLGIYEPEDDKVSNETNIITAGGMYSIAIDYGNIAADEVEAISENVKKFERYISEENIYTEEIMGELLNGISRAYFAQLDTYNMFVAGQNDVIQTRALSLGVVGFAASGVYSFGRAVELNEGGYFLDISHDVHSVVSLKKNDIDEKEYMLQTGIYASAMEHGVLEQFTGVESVSTIKVLQYAKQNGIEIHTISKENYDEEIKLLKVEDSVKEDIRAAVNKGRVVIIPEETIHINQWSGSGYMVLDPDTFACGYMISGGLNGGAMTLGEMFCEYISQVLMGIVFMVMWKMLTATLLAMCPCGWGVALGFAISFSENLMLLSLVTEMVALLVKYEQTGEVIYLQELLIQIAALGTLAIVSHLASGKIEELTDKVGEEIERAGLKGACFVAGTLVVTSMGAIPIEQVHVGTIVQSFNPGTLVVSQKKVETTFEKQTSELIHILVNKETIDATTNHPFYVLDRGFVKAKDLRAGDILCTVNGDYVVVEQVQHEILESPVNVYNFSVEDNHTYFVGKNGVGVHNAGCNGVPVPERTQAENGLFYKSNPKHTPGGSGNRFNAGIEPGNSLELFGKSIESPKSSSVRFSYDENTGVIHRFFDGGNEWHWSGSSDQGLTSSDVPTTILRLFKVKAKGW